MENIKPEGPSVYSMKDLGLDKKKEETEEEKKSEDYKELLGLVDDLGYTLHNKLDRMQNLPALSEPSDKECLAAARQALSALVDRLEAKLSEYRP